MAGFLAGSWGVNRSREYGSSTYVDGLLFLCLGLLDNELPFACPVYQFALSTDS